jgi:uncharacterized lipoprotein YddW (UPF0748 family)
MSYERAFYEAFQDWPFWVNGGLVDFVTIMNYSPELVNYERWNVVAKTKILDHGKLNVGVGAYKLVNSPEVFREELMSCEEKGGHLCAIFHYGSLLENNALQKSLLVQN